MIINRRTERAITGITILLAVIAIKYWDIALFLTSLALAVYGVYLQTKSAPK